MKKLESKSGKKAVIIRESNGSFKASYVQYTNTGISVDEDLIEMKSYSNIKSAEKYAVKVLGL